MTEGNCQLLARRLGKSSVSVFPRRLRASDDPKQRYKA